MKLTTLLFNLLLAVVGSSLVIHAQTLSNEDEILRNLRLRATEGNFVSQYELAHFLLHQASKQRRDPIEAAKWLHYSAEQNHPNAPYLLYRLYQRGLGVPKDEKKALYWLMKAAENHEKMAEYDLACRYMNGDGVPVDEQEAVRWLTRSAKDLHVEAAYQLACRYEKGQGVSQSQDEAFKWFLHAASGGHGMARYRLSQAYETGKGMPKNPGKAVVSLMEAAESGVPEAQLKIGLFYLNDHVMPQDNEQALRWLLVYELSMPRDLQVREHIVKARANLSIKQQTDAQSWATSTHFQIELRKNLYLPLELD